MIEILSPNNVYSTNKGQYIHNKIHGMQDASYQSLKAEEGSIKHSRRLALKRQA